ncbi:hypothetical protein CBS101457_006523 [Exobasidium rhododendri]|nr:hypothetical protein CBS101457_006523 [Exobasidium rhododendri]
MPNLDSLPGEILRIIAQLIYLDHLPRSLFRCIDPHGLPSTYPDGKLISSTQHLTQSTLHALCLTNSRLYYAAKPLLWRRLQITLPYSFLLLLRSLGASKLAEAYEEQHRIEDDETFVKGKINEQMSVNAMIAAVGLARATGKNVFVVEKLDWKNQSSQDRAMDLVWTEDVQPSGSRYHVTFRHDDPDMSEVHRFPRVLDFSTFRTQGMRRTVGEGETRFVTPAKLLALITATSEGLMAFGASSTMDSALSLEVLEALLFRDGEMISVSHHNLRGVSMERSQDRERRTRKRLESLDLCNCTSRFFEAALGRFVEKHLRKFSGRATSTVHEEEDGEEEEGQTEEDSRGRARSRGRDTQRASSRPMTMSRSKSTHRSNEGDAPSQHPARATLFPSVLRLGLNGIYFSAELMTPFVLAFPKLTHLDLSGTKTDDVLLRALASSTDMELESLSLARCSRITSQSITELLVDSPVCANLMELSLEGSLLYPTPVNRLDLELIITSAPFMLSGQLRYLDLGGCGLDDNLLALFPKQSSLIDLGLSASPRISLESIAQLLLKRAPNVQVLELVESCESRGPMSIIQLNSQLLLPCTTTPPMTISEQLAAMGFSRSMGGAEPPPSNTISKSVQAKTNLRVVGLSVPILKIIQGAMGNWNVILGAGRRGWLIDVSSGVDPEAVDEDLEGSDDEEVNAESSVFASNVPMKRGRQGRQIVSGTWEPETPPRRLSRSPSGSYKKVSSGTVTARPSHSRSRSRLLSPSPGQRQAASIGNEAKIEGDAGKEAADEGEGEEADLKPRTEVIRNLARSHPRRLELERLSRANGHVSGTTGWHSKKMEVLLGMGMLGRESGGYAYTAYQA